ncbi:MAG: hypothetical protein MUP11_05755 [Anaerolineales bacterium]|nr:hypothetical protein [Anaerolineales bacterium]
MAAENIPNPIQPRPQKPASRTAPGILLRLVLALIAGTLIGAVVYFAAVGWIPYLDQRIFQPIDNNRENLNELEATQMVLESQIEILMETLESYQTQIDLGIQSTLEVLNLSITQLSDDVGEMQSDIDHNTYYGGTVIPAILATVSAKQDSTDRNLSALATAQMRESGTSQEIDLLRILELFSRANQDLLHDNYGQAEEELLAAQAILQKLELNLPASQRVISIEILGLVNQIIADLPSKPVLAAEKLQLAWQMGINGFPEPAWENQTGTVTPTPNITPSPTPTPTPN